MLTAAQVAVNARTANVLPMLYSLVVGGDAICGSGVGKEEPWEERHVRRRKRHR
jgi:hypothetical protein